MNNEVIKVKKGGFKPWQAITFQDFAPRYRYIKDEDGNVIEKRLDRVFATYRAGGRAWLESHYNEDDQVQVFMLGHKNVVFCHKKGAPRVIANNGACQQAREYVKWYCNQAGIDYESGVDWVDDLPTVSHTRARSGFGAVNSIDSLIAAATDGCDLF